MILVDVNLLIYAEDSLCENHAAARTWWDAQLSGTGAVGLCWPVISAYVRIGTNARASRNPLTLREAVARVQSWLDQPCVSILQPTEQHWPIFQRMLRTGNATANLVSDAQLAAIPLQRCEFHGDWNYSITAKLEG